MFSSGNGFEHQRFSRLNAANQFNNYINIWVFDQFPAICYKGNILKTFRQGPAAFIGNASKHNGHAGALGKPFLLTKKNFS